MDYSKAKKDIKKISELTEKFKETMKSKVIFSVIDKSLRLTPFMRIIILLKGFPVKEYNELKKFANSRGVLILNDHDIENKIEALISYSISELVLEKQIHFDDYLKNYNNYKSALNNLINQ